MISGSRASHSLLGRLLAVVAVGALFFGGVVACSSDSESEGQNGQGVNLGQASSDVDNDGDEGAEADNGADEGASSDAGSQERSDLPDGFPNIPLPNFTKSSTLMSGDNPGGTFSVLLTIDPSLNKSGDDLIEEYRTQLVGEGFEVLDEGPPSAELENDEWTIYFHSSMDGTLTVAVSPR
ncbi:MAG: hypothetical protein WC184_07195 [Acidimicrobiia bacterium]